MNRRPIAVLTALLLALVASMGAARDARAITGSITLTVDCYSKPERTTITNDTDETLDLGYTSLGQGFRLFHLSHSGRTGPKEPFYLFGQVAPGASITFETGPGATMNVLSHDELYDDQATDEGAFFITRWGDLSVPCSAKTGTLPASTLSASPPAPPAGGNPPQPGLPNTGGGAGGRVRALLPLGPLGVGEIFVILLVGVALYHDKWLRRRTG
jgi:hypothetical protein